MAGVPQDPAAKQIEAASSIHLASISFGLLTWTSTCPLFHGTLGGSGAGTLSFTHLAEPDDEIGGRRDGRRVLRQCSDNVAVFIGPPVAGSPIPHDAVLCGKAALLKVPPHLGGDATTSLPTVLQITTIRIEDVDQTWMTPRNCSATTRALVDAFFNRCKQVTGVGPLLLPRCNGVLRQASQRKWWVRPTRHESASNLKLGLHLLIR